jgi:hypothetical protein
MAELQVDAMPSLWYHTYTALESIPTGSLLSLTLDYVVYSVATAVS